MQVAAAHLTTANIALEHRPKRITPTELTFTYQSTLAGLASSMAVGVKNVTAITAVARLHSDPRGRALVCHTAEGRHALNITQ